MTARVAVGVGTSGQRVKTGAGTQAMKIFGTSLPAVKPEDIGLGQGVKVTRIVIATAARDRRGSRRGGDGADWRARPLRRRHEQAGRPRGLRQD